MALSFADFLDACKHGKTAQVEREAALHDLHQTDGRFRNTPLMWAASQGHVGCVRALLTGSDVNQRDPSGNTAMMRAAEGMHGTCVKALLNASDLKIANDEGSTALMMIAARSNILVEAPDFLVEGLITGSDLRQEDKRGRTALMLAAANGNLTYLKALIPGSDLMQGDHDGDTALMWAVLSDRIDSVRVLLDSSDLSQIAQTNTAGFTAYDTAVHQNHRDISILLETVVLRRTVEQGATLTSQRRARPRL